MIVGSLYYMFDCTIVVWLYLLFYYIFVVVFYCRVFVILLFVVVNMSV